MALCVCRFCFDVVDDDYFFHRQVDVVDIVHSIWFPCRCCCCWKRKLREDYFLSALYLVSLYASSKLLRWFWPSLAKITLRKKMRKIGRPANIWPSLSMCNGSKPAAACTRWLVRPASSHHMPTVPSPTHKR